MSETMWEYIVLGAIILAAIAFFYFKLVISTSKLNEDPLQQELYLLIVEYANSNLDEHAATLFAVGMQRAFMMNMIVDNGHKQTRLTHALSMCRPHLTPAQYNFVRMVLRKLF